MTGTQAHPVALLFACIFFGYALVNSLVFYRRARRADAYENPKLAEYVRSRRYVQTVWIGGIIGAIGFAVASWELVATLWR